MKETTNQRHKRIRSETVLCWAIILIGGGVRLVPKMSRKYLDERDGLQPLRSDDVLLECYDKKCMALKSSDFGRVNLIVRAPKRLFANLQETIAESKAAIKSRKKRRGRDYMKNYSREVVLPIRARTYPCNFCMKEDGTFIVHTPRIKRRLMTYPPGQKQEVIPHLWSSAGGRFLNAEQEFGAARIDRPYWDSLFPEKEDAVVPSYK